MEKPKKLKFYKTINLNNENDSFSHYMLAKIWVCISMSAKKDFKTHLRLMRATINIQGSIIQDQGINIVSFK